MGSVIVEQPALKAVALRFLIAHAEQPHLLSSERNPTLQAFSQKEPFYDKFLSCVSHHLPEYDEKKLLDTNQWMPQAHFRIIQDCFKELSGIHNPLHYSTLGRIVPAVSDSLTQLASMAAGPAGVINLSARYNRGFNNDQEIIIEKLDESRQRVNATIQHYFLPHPANDPHYLEMITAGLGYWEGIPGLWGFPINGETKILDVQIPLEQLINNDYKYLNLTYREDGKKVYINNKQVGKKFSLQSNIPLLGYSPKEELLEKELGQYTPIEIFDTFAIDGETIFPKGVRYGMPCNRYEISIPNVTRGRRIRYALSQMWSSLVHKKDSSYHILVRRPAEVVISEALYEARSEGTRRLEAQAEADRARAETAEARAEVAEAQANALEAKLTLEQQVSGVNQAFSNARTLAHDNKNHALALRAGCLETLNQALQHHPNYNASPTLKNLFADEQQLALGIDQLLIDNSTPKDLLPILEYSKDTLGRINEMIENDRSIMAGGMPVNIQDLSYLATLKPVIDPLRRIHPQINIKYELDQDITLQGDERLLKVAFTNLIANAAEASYPNGTVTITPQQKKRGDRLFTIIDIYQSGYIPPDIADKLNSAEAFTTKKEGNATGAQASYNIITGPHNGTIKYNSKDDGGQIRIII